MSAPVRSCGVFAGSLTSTPTLQAALDLVGDKTPSIGYSVAIRPILCFYLMSRAVKPSFPPPPARFQMAESRSSGCRQRTATLRDILALPPPGVQVSTVGQEHRNRIPDDSLVLQPGDGLLIVADQQPALADAVALLGRLDPGQLGKDRSDLSYQRFFFSKQASLGFRSESCRCRRVFRST